jgi:hypothetical protein
MACAMLHQNSMATLLTVVTSLFLLAPGLPVAAPYEAAGPSDNGQHDHQIDQGAQLRVHDEANV